MDPLSALKMMVTPDLGAKLANLTPDTAAAKAISLPDLQGLSPTAATQISDQTGTSSSFQNLLGNFVNEVSQKQSDANQAVTGLMSGKNVSLHQAMISMEEASVSFQMMVEVRNKILDSYQELMRMSV